MITVRNAGPLVAETDYWGSDLDRAGGFLLSPNAGALRLLIPSGWEVEFLRETKGVPLVIVSRGPWPEHRREGVEVLFDDGTADPYAMHLDAAQCVPLVAAADHGRAVAVTVWTRRRGRPHLARAYPGRFRVVAEIPCLKPWGES